MKLEFLIHFNNQNIFVKLFNKIVESEVILKVKKANVRINLLIINITVTFKRTLNKISNEQKINIYSKFELSVDLDD